MSTSILAATFGGTRTGNGAEPQPIASTSGKRSSGEPQHIPSGERKVTAARLAAACLILGIDPAKDLSLLYLAEKFINAPLPEGAFFVPKSIECTIIIYLFFVHEFWPRPTTWIYVNCSKSMYAGWVSYEDDRNRVYYHDLQKDVTQWAHPLEEWVYEHSLSPLNFCKSSNLPWKRARKQWTKSIPFSLSLIFCPWLYM